MFARRLALSSLVLVTCLVACGGKPEPKAPALFLFDDGSVREVLPRYGDYLIACFDEKELVSGTYAAVAGVHDLKEDDRIPRAMGHYAPSYDAACVRKESAPESFAQYLAKAHFAIAGSGGTYELISALASALFALSERTGKSHLSYGHKSPHKRLLEALDESSALEDYLTLVNLVVETKGVLEASVWKAKALPLVHSVLAELSGGKELLGEAEAFLEWPSSVVAKDGESTPSSRPDNFFGYPQDAPKVQIRLGSIHSVKGETHTATLVLDSFYHDHHLSALKPWLLGVRAGGSSKGNKGRIVMEGARMRDRLKLHYVAMTRPSHLLCLAMRKDAFVADELEVLKARGWQVVDCCPSSRAHRINIMRADDN